MPARRPTHALPCALDLVGWAGDVARDVARSWGARDQERDDLVGHAVLLVCELLARSPADGGFDLGRMPAGGEVLGAWRGWAHPTIYGDLVREVKRMRAGGLIKVASRKPIIVAPLGDAGENLTGRETIADSPEPTQPATMESPSCWRSLTGHRPGADEARLARMQRRKGRAA